MWPGFLQLVAYRLPAALGPASPGGSLSAVSAQSAPVCWQVAVTTTPVKVLGAWVKNTACLVGQAVTNDTGKVYVCRTAGTSQNADGAGPTGVTTDITDGTAHWDYVAASGTAFKGSLILQVLAASANTIWYGSSSALSKGGKEIGIGGSGEGVFSADPTSLWVYSTGTATLSVVAYP